MSSIDLNVIIEATKAKSLQWAKEGESNTFIAFSETGDLYSLTEKANGSLVFECIDRQGNTVYPISEGSDNELAATLYDSILASNGTLSKSARHTVSFYRMTERLTAYDKLPLSSEGSFCYKRTEAPYVEPYFTQQLTSKGRTVMAECKVIAVSAPGATGKTALTECMSEHWQIPVFDLHKHPAVGSKSLLGMLFDTLGKEHFTPYLQTLMDGSTTMIIDALDEGYVKTSHTAFEAFLDDIVSIAKDNNGLPFILLGRTSILEFATIYLEEKGVKVGLLQIEPFTKQKAEEFIDSQLNKELNKTASLKKEYRDTRDLILQQLDAFFENESDLNRRQSERFIGYAPVLKSIVALLVGYGENYFQIKADIEGNKSKNVALIRDIVEMILNREQKKIEDGVRNILLECHYSDIEAKVKQAYGIEEQCARILCSVNGGEYNTPLTDDAVINQRYEELIKNWFVEHPFLVKKEIQNIVFEAYILCTLMATEKYKEDVMKYLLKHWRNSYILFDLYNIMADEDRNVDHRFVQYLIDSYKATEKGVQRNMIQIDATDSNENGQSVICELNFGSIGNVVYKPYILTLANNDSIAMPRMLSNIYIDAPINIVFDSRQLELSPLTFIRCKKMTILAEDILLTRLYGNDAVTIECDEFEGAIELGHPQNVVNNGKTELNIITSDRLYFPFSSYKKDPKERMPKDELFKDKYQKLRRTIIQFRAHSKKDLAKYKDKIDNRIGKTDIGKRLIMGLLRTGVLEEKNKLYFINDAVMDRELGLGYSDIRTYVVNDKVRQFLNSI